MRYIFNRIASGYKKHAMLCGSLVTGAKTSSADLLVQTQYEGKRWEEVDWRRNTVFTCLGTFYLGWFQYMQYVLWYPRLFPGTGPVVVAKKVCFDMFINTAIVYYPTFYAVQSMVMDDEFTLAKAKEGLMRYRQNYVEDLRRCYTMWAPCMIINHGFLPGHLRVLWTASISAFWSCCLSILRGDVKDEEKVAVESKTSLSDGAALLEATSEVMTEVFTTNRLATVE